MLRILLSLSAAIVACSPSPQDAAMHRPGQPQSTNREAGDARASVRQAADGKPVPRGADDRAHAAQGPILEAVSAADTPVLAPMPTVAGDLPAEAIGRRTLSTAFVMIGPDRQLTVDLHDGRTIVLRDVVMRPKDYCGVQVLGGVTGKRYCGRYDDVATARPGDAVAGSREGNPAVSDPSGAVAKPVKRP